MENQPDEKDRVFHLTNRSGVKDAILRKIIREMVLKLTKGGKYEEIPDNTRG
jgi:SRSO17 transposase